LGDATPDQLTISRLGPDKTIKTLRKLAISSYLKVRQAEDLRQDIASSLKSLGGPFHADDEVWYYQVDKSKTKRGTKAGKLVRAKVTGASSRSSMVVIDLGTRILSVNQSLLRRDADICSDVQIPMEDPAAPGTPSPLASTGSSSARAAAPGDPELVEDGSAAYAHLLWQRMVKGKLDFPELFAGSARLNQCAA
jgi:hypothetical protein